MKTQEAVHLLEEQINEASSRAAISAILEKANPPGVLHAGRIEVEYEIMTRLFHVCITSVHDGKEILSWVKLPQILATPARFLEVLEYMAVTSGVKMDGHCEEWSHIPFRDGSEGVREP